ncbi:MAG: undecaprenyl-diphosphatase UppP [Candidatus Liptonbacteria bacterium]
MPARSNTGLFYCNTVTGNIFTPRVLVYNSNMLTVPSALILGIVEGFTEFLPISSTAHLNLASDLLGLTQDNYLKTFEVAIQSGAILAVLFLYWRKFTNKDVLKKIFVAFIPTGILGLIFYSFIKDLLIGNTGVVLWSLTIGGLLLLLFEKVHLEKDQAQDLTHVDYKKSLWIGIFQSIAMVPGVSRAGATIVGGMLLGLRREIIVEFSFLLAVPTMLAATGLDLYKNIGLFSQGQLHLLGIGFLASFGMAILSIKFLLAYIRQHNFMVFGFYRILLVIVFLLWGWLSV